MGDKSRTFQPTWTDKFLVREVVESPVCLICNKTQTYYKQSNISRHFNSSAHSDFDSRFPPGSVRGKDRVQKLLLNTEQGEKLNKGKPSDAAVAASVASFKVAYELGKAMAPFTHRELIKTCMVSTVETLFPNKPEIKAAINNVPLSRMTTTQ